MNFGIVILALLLIGGVGFGIILMASQNSTPYVDTYGNTTNNVTNSTHGIITNSTGPITSAGGGIALVIAFFLVIVAVIFVAGALRKNNGYSGRN